MNNCYIVFFFHIIFCVILRLCVTMEYRAYNFPTVEFEDEIQDKVNIRIFYETLCPGSIDFFVKELRPVVELFSPHLELDLIPYGYAKVSSTVRGRYSVQCQHGPDECYGNRVHACVLYELNNNTKSAMFNSCLMKYTRFIRRYGISYATFVNWCGYEMNIRTHSISSCVNSDRSFYLLKNYGDQTMALRPPYVPYVQIYDTRRNGTPKELTGSLMMDLCGKWNFKPSPCQEYIRKIQYRLK